MADSDRLPALRSETARLLRLAWPIVLTNLGWMTIGLVDIVMLGHWSEDALAASQVGNVWVHITRISAMGLLMGMDPVVTQAFGSRDRRRLGLALQRGLVLAALLSGPLIASRFWTGDVLEGVRALASAVSGADVASGMTQSVIDDAHVYAVAQTFSAPFFLLFIVYRQHLQGRGIVRPALWVTVGANLLNVLGNLVLVFGFELGIVGAGTATALTQTSLGLGLLVVVHRYRLLRGAWCAWSRASFRARGIVELVRYGAPVGAHFALEVGAFGTTTLIAGLLGVTATAAHGVAINVASLTFMLPLGISLASVTRVGNLLGERRTADAQRSAYLSLWLGAASMAVCAVAMLVGREIIPRLYTSGADAVTAACAAILPIAAAFQVFDGVQVVGGGVLRGMGRTLPPAVFNFLAWWVIGIPLGWWLAIERGYGLPGLWWAMAVGLGVISVLTVAWIRAFGPDSPAARARVSSPIA